MGWLDLHTICKNSLGIECQILNARTLFFSKCLKDAQFASSLGLPIYTYPEWDSNTVLTLLHNGWLDLHTICKNSLGIDCQILHARTLKFSPKYLALKAEMKMASV